MEHEPTPEQEPIGIPCDHCEQLIPINEDTTYVYGFLHPKDYRYSFCTQECQHEECGKSNYHFVDMEDVTELNLMIPENIRMFQTIEEFCAIYNLDVQVTRKYLMAQKKAVEEGKQIGDPTEFVEVIDVRHWGEVMLDFLQTYDPDPWEFGKFRW